MSIESVARLSRQESAGNSTASLLQQTSSMSRRILNNLTVTLLILLGWQLVLGDAQPASVSGHDLSVSDLLKFATAFGAGEASNETVESVRQSFLGPKQNLNDLTAFEENRNFVYALIKPSPRPDSPLDFLEAVNLCCRRPDRERFLVGRRRMVAPFANVIQESLVASPL